MTWVKTANRQPTKQGLYEAKLTYGFRCKSMPYIKDPRNELKWVCPPHLEVISWRFLDKN